MTGEQTTAVNQQNQAAAFLDGALSPAWSDAEEIRAVISSIPAAKRMEVLSALRALITRDTTDTNTGAFNA